MKKLLIMLGVLLTIVGVIIIFKVGKQKVSEQRRSTGIVETIAQHYLLPTDEEPAIATVTDRNKLSTPLFANAQIDDKLLIYQKNSLVIIYRPSLDKIIAVGPVSIANGQPTTP